MKYKLLTISILSGVFLSSQDALAAKYKVTEVPQLSEYKQHFAMDINDSGEVLGVARDRFNFPYYIESYLDNLSGCGVTDEEKTSGKFDAASSSCIKTALRGLSNNATYQKIGDSNAFVSRQGNTDIVNLLDVVDSELNSLTYSNQEALRAINANGIAVGSASAPFKPISFQQTGDNASSTPIKLWQRDFSSRALVYVNGQTKTIAPESTLHGGRSEATDISDSGYVSGLTSTGIPQTVLTSINNDCKNELNPVAVCVWRKDVDALRTNPFTGLYTSRAAVWKLDGNGDVESTQVYPLGFTPSSTQTANYFTTATAVNDTGLAVGFGHVEGRDNRLPIMPLYYQNNETKSFVDVNEYNQGFSLDVNDSGLIVGVVQFFRDGTNNNQFFTYDINSGEFATPSTFYEQAESVANGVNNKGKVVGEGEYEITTSNQRRRHGFLYDTVSKEFFDLNDLIECNSKYEIVQTRAINNKDQIVATALKKVDRRDALGEVVKDSNGTVLKEDIAVTVILDPIAGEIDDCSQVEQPPLERKGASTGLFASLGLLLLACFRRRLF